MKVLYDGPLFVQYGFVYLHTDEHSADETQPDLIELRGGQVNGLCGAAEPGVLSLLTGTHTGEVPFRIELWDKVPDVDPTWEEVVEASLPVESSRSTWTLSTFDGGAELAAPGAGTYRVRYCAVGMAEADEPTEDDSTPPPDRYLLQLWPTAGVAADAIVRQTTEKADYWHQTARATSPPRPRADRISALAGQREAERVAQEQAWHEQLELLSWGGTPPTEELRNIGGRASQLGTLNRRLLEGVAALSAERQRQLAVWCARRAFEAADLQDSPTAVDALAALNAGGALPGVFDTWLSAWHALVPTTTNSSTGFSVARLSTVPIEPPVLAPAATAIDAVLQAAHPDPARAAVGAVDAVARSHQGSAIVDEIRAKFLLQ